MTVDDASAEVWGRRIRAARRATTRAQGVEDQVIRDAHIFGGLSGREIVAAYGSSHRNGFYETLRRAPHPPESPVLPTVLYMDGEGCHAATQERVVKAMWTRGWHTVTSSLVAWHLARGGLFVILVDYSCPAGQEHSPFVTVGLIEARRHEPCAFDLVDPDGYARQPRRLTQDAAAPDPVPSTAGYVLDAEALAGLVADAIGRCSGA